MLERSGFCLVIVAVLAASCATPEPDAKSVPEDVAAKLAVPPGPTPDEVKRTQERAALEAARALVAQAETDVQRARSRRALWQVAWENLVAARLAMEAADAAGASRHAGRASEFAKLGLEQLAYPAVK
jgi:hypothetical protein